MDIVDDLPNYPTILTGDLNGGLSSKVITKIQNGYGYTNLARKAAVKNSTHSTNTFWETSTVGNNSSRCSVYTRSDHYPLISTFSLK